MDDLRRLQLVGVGKEEVEGTDEGLDEDLMDMSLELNSDRASTYSVELDGSLCSLRLKGGVGVGRASEMMHSD